MFSQFKGVYAGEGWVSGWCGLIFLVFVNTWNICSECTVSNFFVKNICFVGINLWSLSC